MRSKSRPGLKPQSEGLRCVVGMHACHEALRVRAQGVQEIFFRENFESSPKLVELHELAKNMGLRPQQVSSKRLERWARGHQGVGLTVQGAPVWSGPAEPPLQKHSPGSAHSPQPPPQAHGSHQQVPPQPPSQAHSPQRRRVVVVLDRIQDPQNLGSMLRTAWVLGVEAICVPKNHSVGLTPSVCKVASGGAEHVPVVVDNLFEVMRDLKKCGFGVYGLQAGGEDLWQVSLPENIVLVVGSEGEGLRSKMQKFCEYRLGIPQIAENTHLNAATAMAIACSHALSHP